MLATRETVVVADGGDQLIWTDDQVEEMLANSSGRREDGVMRHQELVSRSHTQVFRRRRTGKGGGRNLNSGVDCDDDPALVMHEDSAAKQPLVASCGGKTCYLLSFDSTKERDTAAPALLSPSPSPDRQFDQRIREERQDREAQEEEEMRCNRLTCSCRR